MLRLKLFLLEITGYLVECYSKELVKIKSRQTDQILPLELDESLCIEAAKHYITNNKL